MHTHMNGLNSSQDWVFSYWAHFTDDREMVTVMTIRNDGYLQPADDGIDLPTPPKPRPNPPRT